MNRYFSRHRVVSASLITMIFLAVVMVFLWSIGRYWSGVLQPRLQLAAETHAQVLADAQAAPLVNVLEHVGPELRRKALVGKIQEQLLITDPAIDQPLFRAVQIAFDYDVLLMPSTSLDMSLGDLNCPNCYLFDVPLENSEGALMGVATVWVTDAYYRRLGGDMKSKLYAELSVALVLFGLVWLAALTLFFRLQRARELIEISDRAKTRFMANVSHELRTPLNAILGYTQLYKRNKTLMRDYGQGINTIDRSADHLLLMINDILDFSRADSEHIQLFEREVVLHDFLSSLVEMAQIRARLKDISFSYQFSDDLPEVVLCDDKRLRQVLLNLLNNAVKFTRQGGVEFNVRVFSRRREESFAVPRIIFEVIDSGSGIPADKFDEIFLPFHQLEDDEAAAEGSGLGLAISSSLLALMGAQLKLESTLNVGSRFWFDVKLPAVVGVSAAPPLVGTVTGYQGERRHILAVDDNAFNRDVIRQRLSSFGFTVSEASGGGQALKILAEEKVDLVLLDLLMPGMDGFETLKAIRANEAVSALQVIALTAAIQVDMEQRVQQAGFDALLIKPVRDVDLLLQLQHSLALEWEYAEQETDVGVEDDALLVLPEQAVFDQLMRLAQEHNVLGLRDMLTSLEAHTQYVSFVARLQPLVRSYQFRKVVSTLNAMAEQNGKGDAAAGSSV